ncbi:S1/P1 nuclease [Arenimonas fontis]|uniref:S1/P1 nuclease n=2 Tax=Arenimonas fontis TaxID=2608255 RepID=A0A5B2ZDZ7_9GAMM|nr:S1/P1 nuclease [Arenimonas fontis]
MNRRHDPPARPGRLFPLLLALALAAPAAQAWSRQGHELVAELAEADLSPAARDAVRDLLSDEPVPTLAAIAAWADDIRAEGGALGEASKHWHYVNIPGSACDYVPARDCPDGDCIIGAIARQRAILADAGQPRRARTDALKFLVHLVGDAHQPMHAGYPHDRGGNDYQIQYRGKGAPEGEGTNLHRVWDYWLLRSANLDTPTYAARLRRLALPEAPTPDPEHPARDWALESCRLIHAEGLYPSDHDIGDDYLDRHRPLAERRIRLAGARLAALLNEVLDPAR